MLRRRGSVGDPFHASARVKRSHLCLLGSASSSLFCCSTTSQHYGRPRVLIEVQIGNIPLPTLVHVSARRDVGAGPVQPHVNFTDVKLPFKASSIGCVHLAGVGISLVIRNEEALPQPRRKKI